jgi:cyanophycin synthetase
MKNKISLGTKIIISEFRERGYNVKKLPIGTGIIEIYKNDKKIIMAGSDAPVNFALGSSFAKNKYYSNYFCKVNKIPVPKHIVCNDLKQVKKAAKKIKFPVVIKPLNLAHGEGVIVNIKNIKDLLYESDIALEKYKTIAVEKYIRGRDHRLLVVDGKFVSSVMRIPATVIGDGKNSIKKLINIENKNPLRGVGYTKPLVKIEINDETKKLLIKNEYTLDEVPRKGEVIYLKETSNQSKGGETEVITDKVHKSYIKLAEKAAKVIGLKYAGVDIVTEDISKDNYGNLGKVIEVNSFPGIDMHQYPSRGKGDNVGKVIVDMIEKYCFK